MRVVSVGLLQVSTLEGKPAFGSREESLARIADILHEPSVNGIPVFLLSSDALGSLATSGDGLE